MRGRGGMVSLSLSTLLETHILDFMTHHSWTYRDVTNWGFCKVRRHTQDFVDVTTWGGEDLGRLDEWSLSTSQPGRGTLVAWMSGRTFLSTDPLDGQ